MNTEKAEQIGQIGGYVLIGIVISVFVTVIINNIYDKKKVKKESKEGKYYSIETKDILDYISIYLFFSFFYAAFTIIIILDRNYYYNTNYHNYTYDYCNNSNIFFYSANN